MRSFARSRSGDSRPGAVKGLILLAVALFLLAVPARGESSIAAFARYRSSRTQKNVLDQSILYGTRVTPWLEAALGARLALSLGDVEAFDYKGELVLPVGRFFRVGARLYQSSHMPVATSLTQLFFHAEGTMRPFDFLELFGTFGWHERFTSLKGSYVIPFIGGTSFRDHDFAAAVGFTLRPVTEVRGEMKIATFEEFDVFNLNSPFLQVGAEYRPLGALWSAFAFTRYRLHLGFGRMDELTMGVGFRLDFADPSLNRLF